MQLKFIDLKNGDIDAIYCKIEKEINIIYDKYSFIINNVLFKELVLKTIKALRKLDIEDDVNVYSKIEEYLVTKLDDIVKEQIEINIIDIFNKFIEVKLLGTNNSYNALMELEKLSFFSSYNINLSFDDSIELINNNTKLNTLLELVVLNNKKVLSVNGPEAISSTEIVTCLIDSYCVINQYEEEIEEVETTRNFDDNVKLYLKDISRYKLLSLEEERVLAYRVLEGDKKASKDLINHNLRLVVSIAKKNLGRGLSFDDLIQEGNLGLMKAVEKFDISKGYRFSTYATWWIKQAITRAISETGRNIRIPVATHELLLKFNKAYNQLEGTLGRQPTNKELARHLNISEDRVLELYSIRNDTVSLNNIIGDEGDTELGDFIPTDENIEDTIERKVFPSQIKIALEEANLTDKELYVICLRYGLTGEEPATLEQIGNKLNVSRERIRQIESKALRKLSRNKQMKALYAALYSSGEKETESSSTYYSKPSPRKKTKSLYETFSLYTKEQVDYMITQLTPSELSMLHLKFGYDFNYSYDNYSWTNYLEEEYKRLVLPKMQKILADLRRQEELMRNKKFNANEFLDQSLRIKIAYDTGPYTLDQRAGFNYLIDDYDFKKVLKEFPELHSRILYYRLGIGRKNYMTLSVIAALVSLEKFEVSNILMDIFMRFDKYMLDKYKQEEKIKRFLKHE